MVRYYERKPLPIFKLLLPIAVVLGVYLLVRTCFVYVPPGEMLVVIAQGGRPLASGKVLADPGERGVQREVLAEGWHFLPPYGYKVELSPATSVPPGFVGVKRRLLGRDGAGRFAADNSDEKGILRDVLQPGLYHLNPKEFEVILCEVGIYQTSYRADKQTAIEFPARDGNTIGMDCTIEWEILPSEMPALAAEYGTHFDPKRGVLFDIAAAERNVIDQHARKISRDRGFNYGAQDFLDGEKRETFQNDFQKQLEKVCQEKNVRVRSAFIRNIVIPEKFLSLKRDRQLAIETRQTNKAKQETAASDADVQREKSLIAQAAAKVEAETKALVAEVDRDVQNQEGLADAEIEKLKATYAAKTAELDAERKRVLGEAEAKVTTLRETAKSGLYKMKMDVFQNDGAAFLKYTFAEQLNPKLVLRLFHSGPGTFWTNLDNKNVQLMLPTTGPSPEAKTPEK